MRMRNAKVESGVTKAPICYLQTADANNPPTMGLAFLARKEEGTDCGCGGLHAVHVLHLGRDRHAAAPHVVARVHHGVVRCT